MTSGIFGLVGSLLISGCNEQTFFVGEDVTLPGPEDATIIGRACSPSGRTWLADAIVYTHLFDYDGHLYETRQVYTDPDGYWFMEDLPPERTYTFYVQYGDEIIEEIDVFLDDGETEKLEEPDCFDPLQLDVAVITGDYDDFQLVLNNMGFANYQLIDGLTASEVTGFLLDPDAMSQYDMIFFNGGHVEEGVIYNADEEDDDDGFGCSWDSCGSSSGSGANASQIITNIQDYVNQGGSIYASDWAYDVVEVAFPEALDFVGSDDVPDDAQLGEYDLVTAAVTDSAMAEWLGSDYIDVEYDLPVWPPVENAAGYVSVHLSGNVEYRIGQESYTLTAVPLLASFSSGDGKVAFSTFRVAKNGSTDMMLVLQYMMYNL